MQTLMVHLQWNEPSPMVEDLLVSLYPYMVKIESDTTHLLFRVEQESIPLPLEDLHDLLVTDFQLHFTLLVMPEQAYALLEKPMWLPLIEALKPGYYDIETALIQGRRHQPDLFSTLKERLNTRLSQTDITTVLALASANMILSTAAKNLYIHRNTMLYRLEHITRVTGIDVKTFKGLFILYSVYKMV
ncbi:MAG: helix-turn-helix domain-containing protein [Bacillota bacterium]